MQPIQFDSFDSIQAFLPIPAICLTLPLVAGKDPARRDGRSSVVLAVRRSVYAEAY